MAENRLLRHFFGQGAELDPEDRFDLNRKSRSKRLREIYSILHKYSFLRGFTPVEFRQMLEDLGPSFVKVGQTLSTRSEILPQAYCDELAKLQTECDPLPFKEVLKALRDIYGEKFDTLFGYIDPKPLGSASLAQVHKASLADGQVIAIKVQRPGVKATMAQDIDIMRLMARRLGRFTKSNQMLDYQEVVEEMWATFVEETDFAREAVNLELFARMNSGVAFVECPKVYSELCSEYVLVMEYIEGIPIYEHEELKQRGYDLSEIGRKILDNYATQVLDHGFFHADPHPGNMLIRDGKIVYIDLGIMGRLSPDERAGFGRMIEAVGMQDSGRLKDALLAFASTRESANIDHSRFLADLDIVLQSYGQCDVADLDVGKLLGDILALTRLSKVTLPASVANVSRGIVAIEGTVADFIPNESVISIINAHIVRSNDPLEALEERITDLAISARKASDGALEAAHYSGEMLKMLTRGQLKLNMEVLGSDAPIAKLSRIMNRLTIGIIIAGLFIGSSMYAQFGGDPFALGIPILSFLGFAGALVLSVWVVFDIWRKG